MADRTAASIVIGLPSPAIMGVIADFATYPTWAGVQSAEVLESAADGRARRVRFGLDAGIIRDSYVLGYQWDADSAVRWELAESGSVISELSGGYLLAEHDGRTEVTYELAVGVRIPMIGMLKRRAEKMIIDRALNGLKTRAESVAGGSGE